MYNAKEHDDFLLYVFGRELDLCLIEGVFMVETAKAVMLDNYWLPKSQIHNLEDITSNPINSIVIAQIPEWIAIDKLLI
jgi:hypothetical protein